MAAATSRAPLGGLASLMAMKGREGDSMLVHLSPREVSHLNRLSGNTMTINPHTGLPEGKSRFLRAALPAIAAIAGSIFMPHMIPTIMGSTTLPMMLGAGVGTYGGSRLAGFKHSEALPKAALSAVTAGLFGGLGSGGGEQIAGQTVSDQAKNVLTGKLAESELAKKAINLGVGSQQAVENVANRLMASRIQDEAIKNIAGKNIFQQGLQPLTQTIGASQMARVAAPSMSIIDSISKPGGWPSIGARAAGETGLNLLGDQMASDANKPRDLSRPPTATGELWSQPYNWALQGPYSQQDVAGAYIGDNITPINFYNQGYAKEGGSVQHMAHGGLAGLPVHMGIGGDIAKILTAPLKGLRGIFGGRRRKGVAHPTGQPTGQPIVLGNPFGGEPMSPPLPADIFEQAQEEDVQLAGGGKILNKLVNDWGLLGLGTKALTGDSITDNIRNIMDTPDLSKPPVTPQYFDQAQEVDTENIQLARGGLAGMSHIGLYPQEEARAGTQTFPEREPVRMFGGGTGVFKKLLGSGKLQELLAQITAGGGQGKAYDVLAQNPPTVMATGDLVARAEQETIVPEEGTPQDIIRSKVMDLIRTPDIQEAALQERVETPTETEETVETPQVAANIFVLGSPPWDVLTNSGLNPNDYMYMYSDKDTGVHSFKNINTRKYVHIPSFQSGGLAGAADAAGAMMPALQPLLQVASEEASEAMVQPRTYAQTQPVQPFQAGGQAFEGRVAGRGDGMSDQIPFNIEGQQPALLSRDEYVVPADVVAMVGDGSSNSGADQFDNFIGNIRQMKYGRQVQPRELNQGLGALLGIS